MRMGMNERLNCFAWLYHRPIMGNQLDSDEGKREEQQLKVDSTSTNPLALIVAISGAMAVGYYWGNRSAKKYMF